MAAPSPRTDRADADMSFVSRERLERLIEQAPDFIAYLSGPDHTYVLANRSQRRLAAGRDILGKTVRDAFPELAGQGIFELLDEVYRSGRPHKESGLKVFLADASGMLQERCVDFIYQPVTDDDGSVRGVFVEGHDVTERVITDAHVRENEARLRLALDAARMAIWAIDPATGEPAPSEELNQLFGFPLDARPSLADLRRQYAPGELEHLRRLYRQALKRGDRFFEGEYRIVRADDREVRWLSVRSITDARAPLPSLGVLMDVTERKKAEERVLLLAREVDHRANNLLGAIQSLVNLTQAEDVTAFRESLLGRLRALAHAHRLLAETRWSGARLARLVDEELRPFAGEGQISTEGPDAKLGAGVAEGLAMALHELLTNAVKYGALSRPDGRISVTWGPPGEDGRVQMTWLERGGPPVRAPTGSGFGATLLRRALRGGGGGVELEWQAEGLCCRLRFPVL